MPARPPQTRRHWALPGGPRAGSGAPRSVTGWARFSGQARPALPLGEGGQAPGFHRHCEMGNQLQETFPRRDGSGCGQSSTPLGPESGFSLAVTQPRPRTGPFPHREDRPAALTVQRATLNCYPLRRRAVL